MSIKVTCTCGKNYSVKESLAGKVVRCKQCGEKLRIETVDDEEDDVLLSFCRECGASIEPGEAVCAECEQIFVSQTYEPTLSRQKTKASRPTKAARPKTNPFTALRNGPQGFLHQLKTPKRFKRFLVKRRWSTYLFHLMMWIVAPVCVALLQPNEPSAESGLPVVAQVASRAAAGILILAIIGTVSWFIVHLLIQDSPIATFVFAVFVLIPLLPLNAMYLAILIVFGGSGFTIGNAIDAMFGDAFVKKH